MLIAFSLVLATVFLVLFLKAVKSGQYDDSVTPAMRMLLDDEVMRKRRTDRNIEAWHEAVTEHKN